MNHFSSSPLLNLIVDEKKLLLQTPQYHLKEYRNLHRKDGWRKYLFLFPPPGRDSRSDLGLLNTSHRRPRSPILFNFAIVGQHQPDSRSIQRSHHQSDLEVPEPNSCSPLSWGRDIVPVLVRGQPIDLRHRRRTLDRMQRVARGNVSPLQARGMGRLPAAKATQALRRRQNVSF